MLLLLIDKEVHKSTNIIMQIIKGQITFVITLINTSKIAIPIRYQRSV